MHYLATILQFALGILGMILVFCLAILVHEFGHFLAARLLGFKVDAFSIFFGPALWKRTSGGTEYTPSAASRSAATSPCRSSTRRQ